MQLHRFDGTSQLDHALAAFVAQHLQSAIAARDEATLVLSGGKTPEGFLTILGRTPLHWSRVTITLADERWVPEESPDSNAALLRRSLLAGGASAAKFIPLKQTGDTPEAAAQAASQVLADMPSSFDVVVLGMGDDGHTASLFPRSPRLRDALAEDAAVCYPMEAPAAPHQRLTLSAARLRACRTTILHITGTGKWHTLGEALAGGPEEEMPIRALMLGHEGDRHVFWAR